MYIWVWKCFFKSCQEDRLGRAGGSTAGTRCDGTQHAAYTVSKHSLLNYPLQGLVTEADVDAAVLRLLVARFRQGHFDHDPVSSWSCIGCVGVGVACCDAAAAAVAGELWGCKEGLQALLAPEGSCNWQFLPLLQRNGLTLVLLGLLGLLRLLCPLCRQSTHTLPSRKVSSAHLPTSPRQGKRRPSPLCC